MMAFAAQVTAFVFIFFASVGGFFLTCWKMAEAYCEKTNKKIEDEWDGE